MSRILLKHLIVGGLGYCCEYAFWTAYRQNRQTPLAAERLGVTVRAVQKHKAARRRGKLKCQNCLTCLKEKLL